MNIFVVLLSFCLIILIFLIYKEKKRDLFEYRNRVFNFFNELSSLKSEYITFSSKEKIKKQYKNLRFNDSIKLYKNLEKIIFSNEDDYIINEFIYIYDNLDETILTYNNEYVEKELKNNKKYFDSLFNYPIDLEQRRAIVTDDDNNLIIAGAGSGKTTTIIGKTKYLIEKKKIDPREIITISFTNAAKDNFIEKLDDNRVSCSTFHKLGKDIIDEGNLKSDIAPEDFLYNTIKEYIKKELPKNKNKMKHFIALYSYYMHIPNNDDTDFGDVIEIEKGFDLETLKAKYYRLKKLKTFNGEKVKSLQELIIANYLFLHGIKYVYEAPYEEDTRTTMYRQYHPDFYLPDYKIYLEHFGINKEGRAPQYNEIEEKRYIDGIEAKRKIHEKYNTKLIETYSYEFDNFKIEDVLEKKLKTAGIVFKEVDEREIINTISNIINEETNSLYSLINKFIKMFKGNNYELSKFDDFYNDSMSKRNIRNMYLLEIIKDIYIYYQNKLNIDGYIDFDDMINLATKIVNNHFERKISYIIIDEFQDTSYSRYLLVKAIQDKTNAKVIAVGDDWQSIYRFSGCDLNLFINFKDYFPHPKIMYINNTYRNCQNLIDLAGSFIMQNEKGQIKKNLKSNKENIEFPVEYYYYKFNILSATKSAIKTLKSNGCKKIAILGRNNSDIKRYNYNSDPNKKEIDMSSLFNYNVVFTTVHKSKGLEYDGVILCNMDNYIAGFPNKMADDPILDYVSLTQDDYLYEEERRLFYVALTRTKTKCLILVPISNPSMFSTELYDLSNKSIPKKIIEDDEKLHNPKCPKCENGILVTRQNSMKNTTFVGCSNYPICDFTYNKTDILENTIKCPKCGAYMVKRNGFRGEFYGCINYPYCNQTIENDKNNYYDSE